MTTSFQWIALPHEQFESLFDKCDSDLRSIEARQIVVDGAPGIPFSIISRNALASGF